MSTASPTPLVHRTHRLAELAVGGSLVVLPAIFYGVAVRFGSESLTAAGAIAFLFVVPGLLGVMAFQRSHRTRVTAHVWSLAANSLALVLIGVLLRQTVGFHRASFAAAWLVWSVLLFAAAWRPGQSLAALGRLLSLYGAAMAIGLVAIAASVALLFPEQFLQCFNEDGTETYQLARSLREHSLPHWELETWDPIPGGRMGTVVVNPSLVNSYWTCALQTLMGDGEAATRLPYWVWWAGIFIVSFRQIRRGRGTRWAAVPLALLMMLVAVLFTFYVGYNPYMADIANPGVTDALFTLLLMMSVDCLRAKAPWAWAVAILLASLVLYSGPVLLVLTLVAAWWWKPIERKAVLRWGLLATGLMASATAFYLAWGWCDGSLRYWLDTLDMEYVQHYMADVPRWKSGPLFAGYFLLGSGGIAVLGLLGALRRDAWQQTVATITLLYLLIVLGSGFKNLHWLAPVWPIPLVLFLMPGRPKQLVAEKRGQSPFAGTAQRVLCTNGDCPLSSVPSRWKTIAATCSLLVCLALCWPKARWTFTLNRELGERTTIATDDDLTAATWARVRLVLRSEGLQSWDCDPWTWVDYAQRDARPKQPSPLFLTDGGPPSPDYRLLASRRVEGTATVARLYVRNGPWADWLASRHPLEPLDRYPWVLRPLAAGLYSPHQNTLEDVRRLCGRDAPRTP